jgi:NTE family protein
MPTYSNAWQPGVTLDAEKNVLGLALSGGGFRASLFHIGVLAKLAELDYLRHVQALSTVSGGSIIGALYYLKIKQLLENRRSDGFVPSKQAYITIVQEIECDFLCGVQQNLRMRALLDPKKNAQMLLCDDYSRSDRMSELYQQYFYRQIWQEMYPEEKGDILLKDIKITPPGCKVGFDVYAYNKTAEYKIPILMINATTLNGGAPWIFTAAYMGLADDDKKSPSHPCSLLYFDRQKQPLSDQLDEKARKKLDTIRLSDAVAASACVPVIFAPFAIHDLYRENGKEVVVELVDGGVYDNQGIESLYRLTRQKLPKCTHIICSDASGQLQEQRTPDSALFAVAARSNDILMKRVRDEVREELKYKKTLGDIDAYAFFHLRDGFTGTDHFPCLSDPIDRSDGKTDGEIFLLSALRTDLDSFTDIEADTLMYDGYCLADEFLNNASGLKSRSANQWGFLQHLPALIRGDKGKLIKHLDAGKHKAFKVFFLLGRKGALLAGLLVLFLLSLLWRFVYSDLYQSLLGFCDLLKAPNTLITAIVLGLSSWVLSKLAHSRAISYLLDAIRGYRTGNVGGLVYPVAIFTAVGSAISFIHIFSFDRLFLRLGKLHNRACRKPPSSCAQTAKPAKPD